MQRVHYSCDAKHRTLQPKCMHHHNMEINLAEEEAMRMQRVHYSCDAKHLTLQPKCTQHHNIEMSLEEEELMTMKTYNAHVMLNIPLFNRHWTLSKHPKLTCGPTKYPQQTSAPGQQFVSTATDLCISFPGAANIPNRCRSSPKNLLDSQYTSRLRNICQKTPSLPRLFQQTPRLPE